MVFHERFDINSLSNNLVILELQERLKFGDRIRKIKFDTEAAALPESVQDIFVLGWRARNVTQVGGVVFRDAALSAAAVTLYDIHSCQEAYSCYYVRDTHFCTGMVERGSGACSSDIGGPGVAGSVLAGLISFGPARCGARDQPTVYTKLGFYADWIANVTKQIAAKTPTELHKKQENNEIDFDSIKQLAGELQKVLLTKSNGTAGRGGVGARYDNSEEEKDILKSDALKNIVLRIGPEEEEEPELTESNIKMPTPRSLKSKLEQHISTVMTKHFRVNIPRLLSPPTVIKTKIELEMAYDSSDTNSSNAKAYSSASEYDDNSETEEITLPLYNTKLSTEEEGND